MNNESVIEINAKLHSKSLDVLSEAAAKVPSVGMPEEWVIFIKDRLLSTMLDAHKVSDPRDPVPLCRTQGRIAELRDLLGLISD